MPGPRILILDLPSADNFRSEEGSAAKYTRGLKRLRACTTISALQLHSAVTILWASTFLGDPLQGRCYLGSVPSEMSTSTVLTPRPVQQAVYLDIKF